MATINFQNLRYELLNTLRNSNIFSTTVRGVTTTTDNFTSTLNQTNFALAQSTVKNIRSVTVSLNPLVYLRDYTVTWGSTTTVILVNGTDSGEAVAIQYDYGSSDRIFGDMPRPDLSLSSFPRIGMDLVNTTTEPFALGGAQHLSDALLTIYVWMPVNKDSAIASGLGGSDDLYDTLDTIRDTIRTNAKSFVTFPYIYPLNTSGIVKGTNNKLLQISHDFQIKFITE